MRVIEDDSSSRVLAGLKLSKTKLQMRRICEKFPSQSVP